jgi:hypothetical protein
MSVYLDHNDYIYEGWILQSPKSLILFDTFVEVLNTMLRNGTITQSDGRPDNNRTEHRTVGLTGYEDDASIYDDTSSIHTLRYYQLLNGVRRNSQIQINLVSKRSEHSLNVKLENGSIMFFRFDIEYVKKKPKLCFEKWIENAMSEPRRTVDARFIAWCDVENRQWNIRRALQSAFSRSNADNPENFIGRLPRQVFEDLILKRI